MRGASRALSRVKLTQKQRDDRFLERALNRGTKCSEREADLIVELATRYHDSSYEEINQMIFTRSPLELEVMLDNFDFAMSKIKGGAGRRDEHAAQITGVYDICPESHCRWRTAPLAVRRRILVTVRLSTLLEEAMGLHDDAYDGNGLQPSRTFIDMGLKHWSRIDDLIELVLEKREMRFAVIDLMMTDDLVAPLTSGVL